MREILATIERYTEEMTVKIFFMLVIF
jgi:hypothetical protein